MRAVLLLPLLLSACQPHAPFVVEPAPEYDALFQRQDGWTGADIAGSVPLDDGRILWLFGDTWIGKIREGRHVDAAMVSNTVGIQAGKEPANSRVEFHYAVRNGKPAPLFSPPDGGEAYWLTHGGIATRRGLHLFMSRIARKPGDDSPFGFQAVGLVLAHIPDPSLPPERWRPSFRDVPWASWPPDGSERVFGMPLLKQGGMVYLYGLEVDKKANDRFLLVARAPEERLGDFDSWTFFSNGEWRKDFTKAERLADGMGAELSVSFQPSIGKYVVVYTEGGLSRNILLRSAPAPEGPWSAPRLLYVTPEMDWDKDTFCYAAKGHPELSRRDDELIVSYVCNSHDFWKMAADVRIYVPKFVRVRFKG